MYASSNTYRVYGAAHSDESGERNIIRFNELQFVGTWDECNEYCVPYAGSLYTSALVIVDSEGIVCSRWESYC